MKLAKTINRIKHSKLNNIITNMLYFSEKLRPNYNDILKKLFPESEYIYYK